MRLKVLPYVTVEIDDRVRQRVRAFAERLRLNVRAAVLSAADDVDTAGGRVRDRFDAAVHRVDDAVGRATDRLGPDGAPSRHRSDTGVRLEAS
jgi:arylsulfatase A-like enzyme